MADVGADLAPKYEKMHQSVLDWMKTNGCEEADLNPIDHRTYERFLVARDLDLKKSTDMLLACLKWRLAKKPAHIKEDDVAKDLLESPETYFGLTDKHQGQTVYINAHLHVDWSKREDEYHDLALFMMELGLKRALDKGLKAKATLIFYLGQFSMANMDYNLTKWLIDQLANYYPETLRNILVLDSPWAFSLCWKLIKVWLDPRTATKIVFISVSELKTYIDQDNMPKEFGGTNFVFKYDRLTDSN